MNSRRQITMLTLLLDQPFLNKLHHLNNCFHFVYCSFFSPTVSTGEILPIVGAFSVLGRSQPGLFCRKLLGNTSLIQNPLGLSFTLLLYAIIAAVNLYRVRQDQKVSLKICYSHLSPLLRFTGHVVE